MKVVQFFRAIESEGRNIGLPVSFVNLSGCNSNCKTCLPYTNPRDSSISTDMEVTEVAEKLLAAGLPHVYIACGEPMLQEEETIKLLDLLEQDERVKSVTVHTNGFMDIAPLVKYTKVMVSLNWCHGITMFANLERLRPGIDMLKFIIWDKEDYRRMVSILVLVPEGIYIMLSPSPTFGAKEWLLNQVVKDRLEVRVIYPQHFSLGTF